MRHIATVFDAELLALEILRERAKPLVVVSTLPDSVNFDFDAEVIAGDLGTAADVVTIVTGEPTRAIERKLPEKCQVFGGAARSYPPDFGTDPDWVRSRLHFGQYADEARVIDDALSQVAGVVAAASAPAVVRERVVATVVSLSDDVGAIGRLEDDTLVRLNGDMLVPSVTLGDALEEGARVEGLLVDLDLSLEPADLDLSPLVDGSVTLARVQKVTERRAYLSLHPAVSAVALRRRDVVGEDDETPVYDVLAVGDIVEARVRRDASGEIGLSLVDFDNEIPRVPAVALVAGGPPWLRGTHHADRVHAEEPETPNLVSHAASSVPIANPAPGVEVSARLAELTREVGRMSETLTRLARNGSVSSALAAPRRGIDADGLRRRLGEAQNDNRRLLDQLSEMKAVRRRVEKQASSGSARLPSRSTRRARWKTDEDWLRHEILLAWVERVDASEKARYPLGRYLVGSDFAASIDALDEAQFAKAMRAVVDVATGRAPGIVARDVHRLRSGWGGDDPPIVRDDGAKAWRVAIELNTASARRLHYWELPGGSIELSRVVLHDDTTP